VREVRAYEGRVYFDLACGHVEWRKRSAVTRVQTPRPRWPKQIACGRCGSALIAAVFIGFLAVAACSPAPERPALDDARRLRAAVDSLAARAARLDPGAYALPAAAAAMKACDVLGVRTVSFSPGELRFTCNRIPSLGTAPAIRRAGAPTPASLKRSVRASGPVAVAPTGVAP
jgi:hypothetical protein